MSDSPKTAVLPQTWSRLEKVCQRLWDENSSSAVEVQAIIEEFKGEIHRLASFNATTESLRKELTREREEAMAALRRQYEIEAASLKKRLELLEHSVRVKEARADDLLQQLAKKEEENLDFHSQVLKLSADNDKERAKRMEEFYADLLRKEADREGSWQKRQKALEEEHHRLQEVLKTRQAELDAWEGRRLHEEEELKRKATDLELKGSELSQEYRKKQHEIEELKASLQRSITELVRQYQERLRGSDAPR